MRAVGFGWGAVALLVACGGNAEEADSPQPVQVACTMIGCSSGVRVLIEGSAPERYTVHVNASGRTLRTMECTAGNACDIFIENETPTEVVVRIVWGDRDREWTVNPTYRDVQPNGPACPPTCRQGTIAITI
jgi:hypothetical protein